MKITKVETVQVGEFPNCLWVRIHTDAGLVGLGETFYAVAPCATYIHETAAPYLLGKDPLEFRRLGEKLDIIELQDSSDGTIWLRTGKAPIRPAGRAAIGVLGMYEVIDAATAKKLSRGPR